MIILNHYKVVRLLPFFPSLLPFPPSLPYVTPIFFIQQYLSQIKSDHHKTFRETFCGCPMMIKTKSKQIHKQKTNKQINIVLDPKYPSQIKSDHHKTLRETSCLCPMMNKTKNNQTHKQTCPKLGGQRPSTLPRS